MNGIPSFKLEKSVVERRVNILRQEGVEFQMGVTVGKDVGLQDLLNKFSAVFLGIGAQQAKPLDVPGADLKGIWQALPFHLKARAIIILVNLKVCWGSRSAAPTDLQNSGLK